MKFNRAARVVFPVLALLGLVACGGSSSTTSGTGGVGVGGNGGRTSDAGGTKGSGGASANGGTNGGPRQCGTSGTDTCTTAETNAYASCVMTACDAQYKTCLGPDYRNGNYTGACSAYFQCHDQCACGDSACLTRCSAPSAGCTTCLLSLVSCSQTCTTPACYGTGAGGISGGFGGFSGGFGGASGGAGCADLLACCNAATGTAKSTCTTVYSAATIGGDIACGAALGQLKASTCP